MRRRTWRNSSIDDENGDNEQTVVTLTIERKGRRAFSVVDVRDGMIVTVRDVRSLNAVRAAGRGVPVVLSCRRQQAPDGNRQDRETPARRSEPSTD